MRKLTLLAALAFLLFATACGQKGDPHPRRELHRPSPPAAVQPEKASHG